MATDNKSREAPSILAKAFDLLHSFTSADRVMTLTELAQATGLPKSTVHRLLARLIELDAIEHVEGGYRVSVAMARLAAAAPANLMRDMALPYMSKLHHWSGQTVVLGVLRGLDVVILEQVGGMVWHPAPRGVGMRLPSWSAAIGKALLAWDPPDVLEALLPDPLPFPGRRARHDRADLLAELRQVRATNLASQAGESGAGVTGIASTIVTNGQAVGSLGIVFPSSAKLPDPGSHVLRTAAVRLGTEIQHRLARTGKDRWMPERKIAGPSAPDATG